MYSCHLAPDAAGEYRALLNEQNINVIRQTELVALRASFALENVSVALWVGELTSGYPLNRITKTLETAWRRVFGPRPEARKYLPGSRFDNA
jgi:hypothetical protein